MGRKVIIDCDPGIDDAVALGIALFHEQLDVLAVTAVEGCVVADRANLNLHGIVERLDPPKLPRIGAASAADHAPAVDTRTFHGDDGLANLDIEVARIHHPHASEKLICDIVRSHPGEVTVLALGPLTNIARAFRRDPQVASLVDQLILTGGSPTCQGNITPSAEFNIYYDPDSARDVFRSRTTKTLIPFDITKTVCFGLDLIDKLPSEQTRIGSLLRQIVPFFFRVYHQQLGQESINLNDVVGLAAAIYPELFTTQPMAGDVEISGELTRGATVFDQRPRPEWRQNMDVAVEVDADAVIEQILASLAKAGIASI